MLQTQHFGNYSVNKAGAAGSNDFMWAKPFSGSFKASEEQ